MRVAAPILALITALAGGAAMLMAWSTPIPDPVSLPIPAVTASVPTFSPGRVPQPTPLFVPVNRGLGRLSNWHKRTLLDLYLPDPPDEPMVGMH